ncbi:MFS general substrate transporter [Microstroma glucosiphilum]|uniref:MFS general substrate transporter n=1 Tax=Pseudomicrostroma glucosiphilum TaxID=1684307 RepID=A0A316U8T6_9BASI|nr:MFS general substrate transporter [Pseudomicrostroma glucosiphilum]PWN20871.1 MFS general substrate transporter [Pseudomicrostroma glucosiphilum]
MSSPSKLSQHSNELASLPRVESRTALGQKDSLHDSPSESKTDLNDVSEQVIAPLSALERPPSHLKDFLRLTRKSKAVFDLDTVATQPSVYDDPHLARFSQPHPEWENKSRFDPLFRWTWREEKKLIRKLDFRIALWAFIMFFALDLDRQNITQANSDGMLADLGINTNDYNLGQTLFRIAFLTAELPSQLISKRVGADVWVPIQMVCWSILSASQFWMTNRSQFLAFRFLIGLFQGGFIPDVVLYLSYFYVKTELPLRLAFFWCSNYTVKIASPFLAMGVLRIHAGGNYGWQWLFMIDGLLTLSIGLLSFYNMPASPTDLHKRRGWVTEREEYIIVNRIIRDDPTKGSMHNRQGLDWTTFKKSLADYDLWPLYLIGLLFIMPSVPLANYLTLQLTGLGFDTLTTNALVVPSPALGILMLILVTLVSELVDNRSFVCMSANVWFFIFTLALYLLPANSSRWEFWIVATLQQAWPYVHAAQVGWLSRNSGSVRTRTVSAAVYNMLVQVSTIIGANVYQESDKPLYKKGNLAMTILAACNCALYVFTFYYYRWRNSSRDNKWSAMTKEQQVRYLQTTKDEGNRRLDWRFAY